MYTIIRFGEANGMTTSFGTPLALARHVAGRRRIAGGRCLAVLRGPSGQGVTDEKGLPLRWNGDFREHFVESAAAGLMFRAAWT